MRSILKRTLGRGSEDQKGFTLIELLVVVGIIVALAAVIVPLVIQFAGRGEIGAASAEWDAIQSAIDTMMADVPLIEINPGTSDFITRTLDLGVGAVDQDLSAYVRDLTTVYCYTWDGTGRITAQFTAASPGVCP
ncbi:MAG: prepilin-type N-terminal cleavage/methylation domain-containing protein [Chloroflexi bacterium]|nr:prepilin-type N-terminal cleavage/methylation domain-containing protein [Chloroflexota bacterium]